MMKIGGTKFAKPTVRRIIGRSQRKRNQPKRRPQRKRKNEVRHAI